MSKTHFRKRWSLSCYCVWVTWGLNMTTAVTRYKHKCIFNIIVIPLTESREKCVGGQHYYQDLQLFVFGASLEAWRLQS